MGLVGVRGGRVVKGGGEVKMEIPKPCNLGDFSVLEG